MNIEHDPVDTLARVDLNLLVAFDALAHAGSVTRAATRLGVTQSAASHTLRRLRALFDDPLLVRSGSGMALTPRAQRLQGPVHAALVALGRTITTPDGFEPSHARRAFRLASPDLFDALMLPALLARLTTEAPGVDLAIVPSTGERLADDLARGDVDVAIVPVASWLTVTGPTSELVRRTLFEDGYRCFLRQGHPALAGGVLSLRAYAAAPHLLVSPTGEGAGFVDALLAERGLRRRIALRVPGFALTPDLIARSDLVLTAPASLQRLLGNRPVVAVEPPLPVPDHGIAMLWHRRFGEEPGHRWFRALLAEVAERGVGHVDRPTGTTD